MYTAHAMTPAIVPPHPDAAASFAIAREGETLRMSLHGRWILAETRQLDGALRALRTAGCREVEIDCGGLERLDTAGAWLLLRTKRALEATPATVMVTNVPESLRPLVETIERGCTAPPVGPFRRGGFVRFLDQIGGAVVEMGHWGLDLLEFFGRVANETVGTVLHPRRLRGAALIHQIEETGLNALPILGLLSFLIGVVFAFQGADQLRRFGAEVFTVNLLAVSILREIGGLMAAIIVAGRSGSAFTAQIGTMMVNEEIDALETLGMSSVEVLVLPRVVGLIVALPLLTFYANVMGLTGGAVISYFDLGITFPAFLRQLHGALHQGTFWVGLIKAPVFAFIIALVGCFEGLRVERNAGSVGRMTTQSVVASLFLVIIADAMFSILFDLLDI
ncbi:MAG: phospholipid/cholesterol/gamma-HCH transport system permease protein [Aliidongia sp.]|nr:phospholipid/cholesterol/gamma-HCH transport system permease protein [Aliidongia sp.]